MSYGTKQLLARGFGASGAFVTFLQEVSSRPYHGTSFGLRRWCATSVPQTSSSAAASSAAKSGGSSSSAGSNWSPFSAVMFIPSVVCGCLAYWQYERMKWKDDLISLRRGIAEAEARSIFGGEEPLLEYDKVEVRGKYLHEYSLFVGPRPRSAPGGGIQSGYIVVTPMLSADRKGVVLVNRGWVPTAWKEEAEAAAAAKIRANEEADKAMQAAAKQQPQQQSQTVAAPAAPAAGGWRSWLTGGRGGGRAPAAQPEAGPQPQPPQQQPAPPQEPEVVVGVIQYDEQPSQFMPDNKPESDEFHFIQREHLARVLGLPPDTPLVMAISTDPAAAKVMQKRSPLDEARSAAVAAAVGGADGGGGPAYPAPKHISDLVRFTTMPGDHRNYALIWATLCVVLAFMARTAITKPLRGPRIVEEPGKSARDAWKASQAN